MPYRLLKVLRPIILSIVLVLGSLWGVDFYKNNNPTNTLPVDTTAQSLPSLVDQTRGTDLPFEVHFLDVGQAESIFIQTPTHNVLIDAGERGDANFIFEYLSARGVHNIDLLIATHPHADHIGGMSYLVDNLNIGKVIMPDMPDKLVPTTKTFSRLLDSLEAKDLTIITATVGTQYLLAQDCVLTILAPVADVKYDNLNDISIACRLDYGENSFLFTGDIEKFAEDAILDLKRDLDVDVLNLGHHGSNTSNTKRFLEAASPSIAVASLGADNDYGHPHPNVLTRLEEMKIPLYRTDLNGTIVIHSDKQTISVSTDR